MIGRVRVCVGESRCGWFGVCLECGGGGAWASVCLAEHVGLGRFFGS